MSAYLHNPRPNTLVRASVKPRAVGGYRQPVTAAGRAILEDSLRRMRARRLEQAAGPDSIPG
jgi:hypothetical protein